MKLFNVYNKTSWKDGRNGGIVQPMPDMTDDQINDDSVRTILQPREIIIPLQHVPLITKFLRSKKITFGNFS